MSSTEWSIDPAKSPLLVGCGAVAIDFHFPRIQRLFREPTIHFVEVNPSRFEYLANRWASNDRVQVHRSIPDGEFGLVLVATPPKFHRAYVEQVVDRSEHILIEKPIAIRVADAEAMITASAGKSVKISVNHIRRLLVSYRIMHDLYRTRHFGGLQRVELAEGGVFNWRAVSMGSFSKDLNGGGVLMDTGPHAIDLLCQVFDRFELKEAFMDAWGQDAIEANALLKLEADDGIPVTVNLSRNRNLSNAVKFYFDDAVCTVAVRDNPIFVEPTKGRPYQMYPPGKVDIAPIAYPEFFDRFYAEYVLSGTTGPVSPQEAIRSLRIIEAAYEQAKPMRKAF